MADQLRSILIERDVEQAITALKKGSYLLKYGRRGKPKFCPFRLSNDESMLIWYAGKDEKQLNLSHVSRIIPGQRTAIFQRYPRPEKEYQSFSLIYNDRSLDLICKDKDEAEVWFVALKELIANGNYRKCRSESKGERISSDTIRKNSLWSSTYEISGILNKDPEDFQQIQGPCENPPKDSLGKGCSDVILYTTDPKVSSQSDSVSNSLNLCPPGGADNLCGRCSGADASRISLSSIVSSSSQGSYHEDFDSLGDVYIWGEGTGDGVLGGSTHRVGSSSTVKTDALLPKALNSTVMLDVHSIACGTKHAVLVTKKGEVFSWGEESGGRLGHGVEADVSHPKLVDALSGMNIELVACGEYHTSAVTLTGDLYTWGNDPCNSGILGQGSDASHWIPKKVTGHIEGIHVSSVSCGPWHTIAVTSSGQLFTFGDGTFGALGHGDRKSVSIPREVEILKGMRTLRAACGVWHTAAVVEVVVGSSSTSNSPSGQLFTWGDGDKGRLGHGDKDPRLVPTCIATLVEESFCQVVCGHDITIALTTSGHVYVMGSIVYGQLGSPEADGKVPSHIEGKICNSVVEEIACGSYHVAVLTSTAEVYTWGKGANGRLGHGDNDDRHSPTLVEALKDKQVKSVVCGSNFTAAICLHKWVSNVDQSICSGCHNPFGFRRKRHNCYNCGLVFCSGCSCKKSTKASLAPNINKPYRVCDDCYAKLKKVVKIGSTSRLAKNQSASTTQSLSVGEKEPLDQKLNGQLSKYLSLESFKNNDSRSSKGNRRSESHMSRFTPSLSGSSQLGSFYSSGSSKKMFSASVATSRMASRATSPASSRPSPSRSITPPPTLTGSTSAEVIIDDSEQTNGILSPEVTMMRAQVEEVTRKSQLLEAELERTMRQLKEATAIAEEKAAKYKAAKEVIKSLTAQLKDVAGSVPEESQISNIISLDTGDHQESNPKASHGPESNSHLSNPTICSGTKTTGGEVEWVEQDEPGVYITLSPLPGGGQQLKRVRFSRKRYSEKQAEKWWVENKMRVFKKYNVWVVEKSAASPQTASDEKNPD